MARTPQPKVWPACPTCATPFILRRALLLRAGGHWEWVWFRDCKHRGAGPELQNAEGKVETGT